MLVVVMWLLLQELFALKIILFQLSPPSDLSSAERGNYLEKKWELSKKSLNLIRKTGKENREITDNILAL